MLSPASHIFLSYASEDSKAALRLAADLESRGHRVWYAPRDITPGAPYAESLIDAIEASYAMIVVISPAANASAFVAREVERAGSLRIPIFPIRLTDVAPSRALSLFVSQSQWIDLNGQADWQSELNRLDAALRAWAPDAASAPTRESAPASGPLAKTPKRLVLIAAIAAGGVALVGIIVAAVWFFILPHPDAAEAALDYQTYFSPSMRVSFRYPRAHLVLDETRENDGVIALLNPEGREEVKVFSSGLPACGTAEVCRAVEEAEIVKAGYRLNYRAPYNGRVWSNWYVLSGFTPDGTNFYFRRWFLSDRRISIEFRYGGESLQIYNQIIPGMTLQGFTFE